MSVGFSFKILQDFHLISLLSNWQYLNVHKWLPWPVHNTGCHCLLLLRVNVNLHHDFPIILEFPNVHFELPPLIKNLWIRGLLPKVWAGLFVKFKLMFLITSYQDTRVIFYEIIFSVFIDIFSRGLFSFCRFFI